MQNPMWFDVPCNDEWKRLFKLRLDSMANTEGRLTSGNHATTDDGVLT